MNVWRLRISSNQPEALSIEYPSHMEQPVKAKVTKKVKPIKKKKVPSTKDVNTSSVPLDSPSMGTRSKKIQPPSPVMSTPSKRRLSLWYACSHVLMPCTVCLLHLVNVNLFVNLDISCMCEPCSSMTWTYRLNVFIHLFEIIMYVCTWSMNLYAFEMVIVMSWANIYEI